ncbi:MAG: triose-phosphate isomerase [Actinomycetota bacterium]|jgi:triosephosphate isomerase|nr:triose-phosphate isomerase [Actinomycetota bacterium]
MRRPFIAGNWKMNLDHNEASSFIDELSLKFKNKNDIEIAVCPSFTSIRSVAVAAEKEKEKNNHFNIKIGAQNIYFEKSGAFTGEISADMLRALGVEYVIIGHSERRVIFKEDDELINKKIKSALANGLKPILCVGETLEIREKGKAVEFTLNQINSGLDLIDISEIKNITIAYEPIWAIGTGKTATPEDAQQMCSSIRMKIEKLYKKEIAENIIIQYGGSVKPSNISEIMEMPDIDGALVGGASIKSDDFLALINY